MAEDATLRVGQLVMRKLDAKADWIGHNMLKHKIAQRDRDHFDDAMR
jgi:hypothetical protein